MSWKSFPVLALCLLVTAIGNGDAVAETQAPWTVAAEAPQLTPGDTWFTRYSGGTRGMRKFVREEAGALIFDIEHTWPAGNRVRGILHLNRDLSIVRMLGRDGTEGRRFDPQSLGLRFPLEVGKEWEDECRRFDGGRLVGTFKGKYKVVGLEAVVTPAGRFQTFRVEGQTYEVNDPLLRWRFTHWYSPDVRMEVKVESVEPDGSGSMSELVEFRPAGASATSIGLPGIEQFLGMWEGQWKESILATKLTVERVDRDTAFALYWRGASRSPVFQPPSQQYAEGRFLNATTLRLDVWDETAGRWAEVTYTLNSGGIMIGRWKSGDFVQNARLEKQP